MRNKTRRELSLLRVLELRSYVFRAEANYSGDDNIISDCRHARQAN